MFPYHAILMASSYFMDLSTRKTGKTYLNEAEIVSYYSFSNKNLKCSITQFPQNYVKFLFCVLYYSKNTSEPNKFVNHDANLKCILDHKLRENLGPVVIFMNTYFQCNKNLFAPHSKVDVHIFTI